MPPSTSERSMMTGRSPKLCSQSAQDMPAGPPPMIGMRIVERSTLAYPCGAVARRPLVRHSAARHSSPSSEDLMVNTQFEQDLKASIRSIPDYPKPGIIFRDITTLMGNARAFRRAVDELVQPWAG